MLSKIGVAVFLAVVISVSVFANTITLPGSYQPEPTDIIVLNSVSPDRTITYNIGILQGNEIAFNLRYANLNAMNAPGDTVHTGSLDIFHGNTSILNLNDILDGTFADSSVDVAGLVNNGALNLRLSKGGDSDPITIYQPWLSITDDIPPGTTTDLAAITSYRTALRLQWTSAGDDGDTRNASFYEIRYSKWPVEDDTTEWWGYAEQASNIPGPVGPGNPVNATIGDLDTASTYYFLLLTYDEVGNRSEFSNIASGTTGEEGGGPVTNYCLDFNGINSRAVILNTPALNPTSAVTVEAWINCRDFSHWTQGFILGKSFPDYVYPFSQYFLAVTYTYNEYASVTTTDNVWHKLDNGPVHLTTNIWTHLSFTYDGSDLKLYINGEFNQSTPVHGQLLEGPYNVYIGILEYLDGWGFNGLIDEIRIWNIARTQSEIQATMHQRLSGHEDGLAGYWNFDEGDGQAFFDLTANGSDGFLGSDPTPDSDDPAWVESNSPVDEYSVDTNPGSDDMLPQVCELHQNYPNPFNGRTQIEFSIVQNENAELGIFDMLGRKVTALYSGRLDAGKHTFTWDGKTDSGQDLSSGVYFYRLKTDSFDKTCKMLMVK